MATNQSGHESSTGKLSPSYHVVFKSGNDSLVITKVCIEREGC